MRLILACIPVCLLCGLSQGFKDESFTIEAPISIDFDDLYDEILWEVEDQDSLQDLIGPEENDLQPTWEEYQDGD
jgi:hypothetical protein